jgi:hypothetical protein
VLTQGDPLSPFIFKLAGDAFSKMLAQYAMIPSSVLRKIIFLIKNNGVSLITIRVTW